MQFLMVSGVGRGMGVLDGAGDRRREKGSIEVKCGASHCNQWGLRSVVILCREGWLRGCSQITLGMFVYSSFEILFAI